MSPAAIVTPQEGRAEQAMAALRKLAAPEAQVRRNSHLVRVPERELVPGDIVMLEAGSRVPADLRLLETYALQIEEATLTGESLPVSKDATAIFPAEAALGDRKNMAYKSTLVTAGRAVGIVVGTGMSTEIGGIAQLMQDVGNEQTPLQIRLDEMGRWLVYGALVVCALVFLLVLWRDLGAILGNYNGANWGQKLSQALSDAQGQDQIRRIVLGAFMIAVALAIAAVPEGLPTIVTINLALGMRRMIGRNVIVRRLHAVETLGSVSVICSDKTGTLTRNEMTVVNLLVCATAVGVSGDGYEPRGEFAVDAKAVPPAHIAGVEPLLRAALLSSDAILEERVEDGATTHHILGDPTEGALVVAAAKAGLTRDDLEATFPRVGEIPFDSDRKRMSTLHRHNGEYLLLVKGAPDSVLERCQKQLLYGEEVELTAQRREAMQRANGDYARQGLRVLAVARRALAAPDEATPPDISRGDEAESELTLLGLIAMQDAPRPEAGAAIAAAREAGIKTVMVTGDYAETAAAIGRQIGLLRGGEKVLSGAQLQAMSDEELEHEIENVRVFARVSPAHKVRIAAAFRKRGHIVAMTGDGVNDAPALKQADIGGRWA